MDDEDYFYGQRYEDAYFAAHGHGTGVECGPLCPVLRRVIKAGGKSVLSEIDARMRSEKVQVRDDLL